MTAAALGLSPTVRFAGDLDDIAGEWRHDILAIFREMLPNIARHADASRANAPGGSLFIRSRPVGGTRVKCVLPLLS